MSVGALRSCTLSSRSSADMLLGSMMRRSWFFIAHWIRERLHSFIARAMKLRRCSSSEASCFCCSFESVFDLLTARALSLDAAIRSPIRSDFFSLRDVQVALEHLVGNDDLVHGRQPNADRARSRIVGNRELSSPEAGT